MKRRQRFTAAVVALAFCLAVAAWCSPSLADLDPPPLPLNTFDKGFPGKRCKDSLQNCQNLPGIGFCRTVTGFPCTGKDDKEMCYAEKTRRLVAWGECKDPDPEFISADNCCDRYSKFYCGMTQSWLAKIGTDCVGERNAFWPYPVANACPPPPPGANSVCVVLPPPEG